MNKPTIPNEVADAIEFFRADHEGSPGYINAEIIEVALSGETGSYEGALTSFDFDTLMAALVNGYERELTEEQRHQKSKNDMNFTVLVRVITTRVVLTQLMRTEYGMCSTCSASKSKE